MADVPKPTRAKIILSPIDSQYHADDASPIKADCGHQAWIGPTSLNTVLNPFMPTTTVCVRCVDPKELRASVKAFGVTALPGTHEELAAALGQDEADETYRMLGVRELGWENDRG